MLIIIPILILLFTPLVMLGVRLIRPNFRFFWLVAVGASLLAWTMMLIGRLQLPIVIPLITWQPDILFPSALTLFADQVSWSFALALATLLLASMLTDTGRLPVEGGQGANWGTWASSMALTGIVLLAVFAENLLTLLLAWATVDLVELVAWLGKARDNNESERVVLAYFTRLIGLLVVIAAGMIAFASGSPLAFTASNPEISIYLLVAAGIRLGVLPPTSPHPKNMVFNSGWGTLLRLAPAAASLVLLPRTGVVGISPNLAPYIQLLSGLAVLYAGIAWLSAKDETQGQPFWILGIAAMALVSATLAQPEASLAWGIACLLSGGLLFLAHTRSRRLAPVLLIGVLTISTLPFTPTWQGVRIYEPSFRIGMLLFLIGQALFMSGYIRHVMKVTNQVKELQRWMWVIYFFGLVLILLVQVALGWWSWRAYPNLPAGPPALLSSWPGLFSAVLVVIILLLGKQAPSLPERITLPFERLSTQLYRVMWGGYYAVRRLFSLISTVLEGQAGILWTLLLLALLASFLAQIRPGP